MVTDPATGVGEPIAVGDHGSMTTDITHQADDAGGRYTLLLDGEAVGELDHRDQDGARTFTHTGVRTRHEGKGLAAELVRRGLDDARTEGVRVIPACSYVATYLDRHPDDQDLIAH